MGTLLGRDDDFGGGVVRLRFTSGGETLYPGRRLSRDEVLAMPNYRSLVRSEYLALYPRASAPERFAVVSKSGSFRVIEGSVVGEGLTKEQASQLVEGV